MKLTDQIIGNPSLAGFQILVHRWMLACFGSQIAQDAQERNFRFLEESLELVQACGCSKDEALQLVEYVFDRKPGDIGQEVGGVMVTLAALCNCRATIMNHEGDKELRRVWTKIDQIRNKQSAKDIRGPLPGEWPKHA